MLSRWAPDWHQRRLRRAPWRAPGSGHGGLLARGRASTVAGTGECAKRPSRTHPRRSAEGGRRRSARQQSGRTDCRKHGRRAECRPEATTRAAPRSSAALRAPPASPRRSARDLAVVRLHARDELLALHLGQTLLAHKFIRGDAPKAVGVERRPRAAAPRAIRPLGRCHCSSTCPLVTKPAMRASRTIGRL